MNTALLLMAQYNKALIPADEVVRDFFSHLTLQKFLRNVADGQIKLPLVKTDDSQKSQRSVHVDDLAEYLDERRELARRDITALFD